MMSLIKCKDDSLELWLKAIEQIKITVHKFIENKTTYSVLLQVMSNNTRLYLIIAKTASCHATTLV